MLPNYVSSGVVKSAIRIGVSGTGAVVGDTAVQATNIAVGNQDSFDPKRTATNFFSKFNYNSCL